jgi:hypothetical protein
MAEIRYHYALSHLILVELSCWMDEKQCFFTIFVRTFFPRSCHFAILKPTSFLEPVLQTAKILGPHIPEQSVRHHYF